MTNEKKSPLKRFQEMLASLLTVPKQELDEALEAEKESVQDDVCEPDKSPDD